MCRAWRILERESVRERRAQLTSGPHYLVNSGQLWSLADEAFEAFAGVSPDFTQHPLHLRKSWMAD